MQHIKPPLLLAFIASVPFLATAQTPADCSYNPDFDGDGAIGVVDLLGFLSFFGDTNSEGECSFGPDVDCDGICDAFDDCVGEVDECGVCGGDGPDLAVIDTIIPIMDSVYIEALNGYHVFQAWADTSYAYTCSTAGCIDPTSYTFDPDAHVDDGSCLYSTPGCADGMESVTFDGYTYDLITIGDQCWFAENLRSTVFANGDSIPFVPETSDWLALQDNEIGAWCHSYGEVSSLEVGHGLQYNFFAVEDGRNTCPVGWHVPSDNDWKILELELGLSSDSVNLSGFRGEGIGAMLKADSSSSVPWDGNNQSSFNALASGHRTGSGGFHNNTLGLYWASDPWSTSAGTYRSFYTSNDMIRRSNTQQYASGAIRCIRNAGSECFDSDEDGVCPVDEVYGCVEEGSLNYNPEATESEPCQTSGCMDEEAYNFDVRAVEDDGSCAYATPGCADGTQSVTFDGHEYDLVTVGDQCWFAENLRTTIYANGDSIIDDLTPFEWSIANYGETSASTIYSDPVDSAEVDSLVNLFGRLYNGFAASDGRSVCPSGWKVPRDADWIELEMSLGLPEAELYQDGWRGTTQGNVLKADDSPYADWNGLNTSGLNLIPSGQRRPTNSIFSRAGIESWLWALPDSAGADFERRVLAINQSGINRRHDPLTFGLAIRCLKNHGESCFDPDEDGVCPEDEVIGCTEPTADNFSPDATEDDASCVWEVAPGCSDGLNHLEFDGYQYELIQIGDQCWFAENLRTTQYANGDSITHFEDDAEWSDATTPASCIFLNNEFADPYNFGPFPSYLERFGRIYNWYAAVDERSICPSGWHLPSHAEQAALMNHLASLGMIDEGEALKANSFNSVPWNGQNRVGFNALPGGGRGSEGQYGSGNFDSAYPKSCHWWTSTELSETNARAFGMSWQVSWVYNPDASKKQGKYIRCVRD